MIHIVRRLLGMSALTILTLATTLTARPAMASPEQCFHQTGFCIQGRFYQYWQHNGGLAEFGYPINAAHMEQNPDTGEKYLTQWFERNRFELHPENTAPYDVLLGRLGDDSLREQGRNWQTERPASPKDGCLWVAETRHNICDQAAGLGFKTYWTEHGLRLPTVDAYGRSVALFGLPLTEATMERNAADHQLYLTQWFERARLEWHPDKPEQYKVLLGLLGTELQTSPAAQSLKYFWPDVLPLDLAVQPNESSATQSTFTLSLDAPGQFYATISGGRGSEAPDRTDVTIVTVRGQRGIAFTTGAGYSLFWSENTQPYAIRGNLPLPETMQLAIGLEPLDQATWESRLK